jgi:diguanylate cyclase (GGDEF)-like protein/PAS domain S-box-containing protein
MDITEGKLNEGGSRECEDLLRESQRIAGIGSYSLDFGTGLWTGSDVLDRMFGIDASDPRTIEGWLALVHPDDRGMMASHLRGLVICRSATFDKEYRIVRATDQAVRWVHGLGRLEFNSQGKLAFMSGTIQDITARKQAEMALRESRDLLQLLIEQAPVSLAMFDNEMRYLAASRIHLERFNLTGRDFIGHTYYEMIPYAPEHWRKAHRRCLAGERVQNDEDCLEFPDGARRWFQRTLHPWYTGDGAVGGIVTFSVDITERKLAEERQRLAESVFAHVHEGIMITDANGIIIYVNDMFSDITGYAREEVLGRNPRILKSGRQNEEFYYRMWRDLLEKGNWSGEIWNRNRDGGIYPEMLSISAVPNEHGQIQHYVALFIDITTLKEQEEQLRKIAHYDTTTGLPNRILLADRMNLAMAQYSRLKRAISESRKRGQLLAVAYLDLDLFKDINDRHGHDVGDQLLATVARRMKAVLRKSDTLARVGGDEFVAVLLDLENRDSCVPTLKRLIKAASQPIMIGKLELQVSVSIGVTFYPQDQDVAADQLMRQADQAMYEAKLAGKNQYHIFDFEQDRSARGRHVDINHIRQALEAREFALYYQPLVNMREGKVLGAEALIRWKHPDRGLLLPGTFLHVIEDHSLAVEIGEWVIDAALGQMERWHAEGLDISVSVNVAARQLKEPNFASRLAELLAAHPCVNPSSLTLEVVETSALQNIANVSEILATCRKLGVSVALDDFGTGYSSLLYLRHLPADVLKIEWSFVRNILTDPEDLSIIEGIIGLAIAFRRLVVAEGVESVEHGLMLLRMGCDLAQGFGIARPMPAADLPGWVAGWRPDPRWVDVPASSAEERQLLHCAVAHRFWIAAVESYLKGELHAPPQLDLHQCRFSNWVAENYPVDREKPSEFQVLNDLHSRVHLLAEEIVKSKDRNRDADSIQDIGELQEMNSSFLSQLTRFTHR